MPFKSKAQQGYLESEKPEVAKEFEAKTTNYQSLPQHVQKQTKRAAMLKSMKGSGC